MLQIDRVHQFFHTLLPLSYLLLLGAASMEAFNLFFKSVGWLDLKAYQDHYRNSFATSFRAVQPDASSTITADKQRQCLFSSSGDYCCLVRTQRVTRGFRKKSKHSRTGTASQEPVPRFAPNTVSVRENLQSQPPSHFSCSNSYWIRQFHLAMVKRRKKALHHLNSLLNAITTTRLQL